MTEGKPELRDMALTVETRATLEIGAYSISLSGPECAVAGIHLIHAALHIAKDRADVLAKIRAELPELTT